MERSHACAGYRRTALDAALVCEPASVQDRWFARLYLLKPLIFVVLSLFWIAAGILSLGPAREAGAELARAAGAGPSALFVVVAGGLVDILVGAAIAVRQTTRIGLYAALAIQPITGGLLAWQLGYSLHDGWIVISIFTVSFDRQPSGCRLSGCRYACGISRRWPPNRTTACRRNITGCSAGGSRSDFLLSAR